MLSPLTLNSQNLKDILESENLSEISKKILVREDGSKSGKLISEEIDNKLIKESRDLLALGKNKTLKIISWGITEKTG